MNRKQSQQAQKSQDKYMNEQTDRKTPWRRAVIHKRGKRTFYYIYTMKTRGSENK